jgi:alginate O-acetyltransferase complex protein AlgI
MVFADLFFIYFFLPLCLIFYFTAKTLDRKNNVLIIFSLIFYAWGEPVFVLLLLFSAAFNWYMGTLIGKYRERTEGKIVVGGAIVVDLLLLFVFKYSAFFVENINALFRSSIPVPQIALPIGISFFTFQAISYVIDCYWETVDVQQSFRKFLLYLSLFPQLIAGPIVRYSVIEEEIDNRTFSAIDVSDGAMRVIVGLAKKVILANNLYTIVDTFFGNGIGGLSVLGTWYTVIVYTLYVYFDFSGYSDIAIGLGRIFGFHFDENFRYPFACQTIAEFWQRWHISLGSFFRDYLLYVPIGGRNFKYLNLFLVWFCTGMWHGASWNYIIWGLYFGFWIFFEQKMGKKRIKKWKVWQKQIYSKLIIIIGFGIFYFEDFGQLGLFLRNLTCIGGLIGGAAFADTLTWSSFVNNWFLIAVSIACSLPVFPKIKSFVLENRNDKIYIGGRVLGLAGGIVLLGVLSILLVDATNNPFLYFRF